MLLDQAKKTVVKITIDGQFSGTGFFIARDKVLTNAHVVDGATPQQIKANEFQCIEILAKRKDEKADYAVLRVDGQAQEVVIADFDFQPDVNEQENAKFFGYGAEFMNEPTAFDARILNVYSGGKYELQVQAGARAVLPGDSGSPLFFGGRVVGLLFARRSGDSTKAYVYLLSGMQEIKEYFERFYNSKPEIEAEKDKIEEEIEQIERLLDRYKHLETVIEIGTTSSEEFDEIDFDDLVTAIDNKNLVLFLGPEISIDDRGRPLHEEFYKSISDSKRKYIENEGFFMHGSEKRLVNKMKEFYKKGFYAKNQYANRILKKIAQLPINLIVSVAPDDTIHRIFDQYNIKHNYTFYNGTRDFKTYRSGEDKAEKFIFDESLPTIYNALGSPAFDGKYIFTHKQLNDFIKTDVSAKFPEEVQSKIQEATHYIFMGFDIQKFHYKLIIYELNFKPGTESYAFLDHDIDEITKEFMDRLEIVFINKDYEKFVDLLLAKAKEKGLVQSLDQTFIQNTLNDLEDIRVKTVDAKQLSQLKQLWHELSDIKQKISQQLEGGE